MPINRSISSTEEVLVSSQVPGKNLYVLGNFDNGVTVLSQQTRALNLAWALVEEKRVPCLKPAENAGEDSDHRIAIIGAGFAGLTIAAGLISKGAKSSITIFEQRDTLLPLQHGSDTRWLHPHIYNWPANGSEASAAMLPVLNWTAARASDVVVQVLTEWKKTVALKKYSVDVFCNTRHLQISTDEKSNSKMSIEWIGERRDAHSLNSSQSERLNAVGLTQKFDLVIVATGFGLERDNALSYWRNDIIAQPNLEQARRMYLISGQGDGAMIDLLRVRISHYRQDRILSEVFGHSHDFMELILKIYEEVVSTPDKDLFGDFENLSVVLPDEFEAALQFMSARLRRDTDAILRLKVRKISDLFNSIKIKMSFQNKILVYFLYKCGGFVPSRASEADIATEHVIPDERVLKRHGTDRLGPLELLLSEELYSLVTNHRENDIRYKFQQTDKELWSGGYFGFFGTLEEGKSANASGIVTSQWRKEYLPGPTELVATSFCSALAGVIRKNHSLDKRLRVTIHRAINFGAEEVLQQCCEYFGVNVPPVGGGSAGRAFPAINATIGLAYRCRRTIRSFSGIGPDCIESAMQVLQLQAASGKMVADIQFVLAIPVLEPQAKGAFIGPSPVAAVIYIDSTDPDYYLANDHLEEIVQITSQFLSALVGSASSQMDRIQNVPIGILECDPPEPEALPAEVAMALEIVEDVSPPRSDKKFQFNFDYSDFIPVRTEVT